MLFSTIGSGRYLNTETTFDKMCNFIVVFKIVGCFLRCSVWIGAAAAADHPFENWIGAIVDREAEFTKELFVRNNKKNIRKVNICKIVMKISTLSFYKGLKMVRN